MASFPLPPSSDTPASSDLLPGSGGPVTAPSSPPPITPIFDANSLPPSSLPSESQPALPSGESIPPLPEYLPPPTPSPEPTPTAPVPATLPTQGSPLRFLPFVVLGLGILGLIIFLVTRFLLPVLSSSRGSQAKQTTLIYHGLWESSQVMQPVLDEFEKQNPDIKVNYSMQSHVDYRERLSTILNQPTPPDVVRFHSTWLPMLIQGLSPAPTTVLTPAEIQSNFYQAVSDAVIVGDQIYAVPTTFEGLALFVNQSMFDTASLQPPQTWEDLHSAAKVLTQKDPVTGTITQAGVALGTANNVDHWPDIVSLMLLQAGVNMRTMPDSAGEVLNYYSLYSKPDSIYYSWNATLPSSVQAFAASKVAMIFAPSWRALDIKALNPSLSWKIYPVPQLPETTAVTWANFWVEGVPKNAPHPEQAWKLVKFLASSQAQQILYDSATKERGYAQSPANKALATTLASNPIIGAYLQQASSAKTFFTTSLTHDGPTGINTRLIKYLEDAISGLNQGRQISQVLTPLQQGFQQVLSQYNIVPAATTR